MGAEDLGVFGVARSPDLGQQRTMRKQAPRVENELTKQSEFSRGEPHFLAVELDGMGVEVDDETVEIDSRLFRDAGSPPQCR